MKLAHVHQVYWPYLCYVTRHKCFVLVAGRRTGAPLWRLLIHDWSKLTPQEFPQYARFFYQFEHGQQPPEVCAAFDVAWKHHQHHNLHHWQAWLLHEDSGALKILPMPEHFVREMVADWAGAGRAITGKWEVKTWYAKNAMHIKLHESTRVLVRKFLEQVTDDLR